MNLVCQVWGQATEGLHIHIGLSTKMAVGSVMRRAVYLAVLQQAANAQGVPNSTTAITFAQPIAQASSPPPATCPTWVFL